MNKEETYKTIPDLILKLDHYLEHLLDQMNFHDKEIKFVIKTTIATGLLSHGLSSLPEKPRKECIEGITKSLLRLSDAYDVGLSEQKTSD